MAVDAVTADGLLSRAEATNHGDAFYLLVHDAGFHNVAVITAEASSAATVSEPPER